MKYITMTALSAVFMLGFILLISESALFPLPNLAGLRLLYAMGRLASRPALGGKREDI